MVDRLLTIRADEAFSPLLERLGGLLNWHVAREGKLPLQFGRDVGNTLDKRRVFKTLALSLEEGERVEVRSGDRLGQTQLTGPKLRIVDLNAAVEDQSLLPDHRVTIMKVPIDKDTRPKGVDSRSRRLVVSAINIKPDPTQIPGELRVKKEKIIGAINIGNRRKNIRQNPFPKSWP